MIGICRFFQWMWLLHLPAVRLWNVVLRFGMPAIIAAFFGALLLLRISGLKPLYTYLLGGREFSITPVKLTIASLNRHVQGHG